MHRQNPFYSVCVCVNTTCNLPRQKILSLYDLNKWNWSDRVRMKMKLTLRCSASYRRFSSSRYRFESFFCSIRSLSESSITLRRNSPAFEVISLAKCDHWRKTSRHTYMKKMRNFTGKIHLFTDAIGWVFTGHATRSALAVKSWRFRAYCSSSRRRFSRIFFVSWSNFDSSLITVLNIR